MAELALSGAFFVRLYNHCLAASVTTVQKNNYFATFDDTPGKWTMSLII
jgi:hypothetical protein